MAGLAETQSGWHRSPWRLGLWGVAAALLLLPAAAMQFTDEVQWTAGDFVFAGVLIGGVGLAFELAVRMTRDPFYRAGVAAALAAAFLIMWANGAVGMIGSEDNPFNLLFYGVIAVALAGAVAARFRPAGMARAMGLAAAAHALTAVIGMFTDLRGGLVSTAFAGLWLLSAWLFGRAARA
jgi:hypothetical protein